MYMYSDRQLYYQLISITDLIKDIDPNGNGEAYNAVSTCMLQNKLYVAV